MLSVEAALKAILSNVARLESEDCNLKDLTGRICAEPVIACLTQPPFAASAMDGYAVRFASAQIGQSLRVIGEAPAGTPFTGQVGTGEAVRIFTGAAIPQGADHVVIQEDVKRQGNSITIACEQANPRNIRQAGMDFAQGDCLAPAGAQCNEYHASLFAAANIASVSVVRRPRVALFSTGDELRPPGTALEPGQIVDSNRYALSALLQSWGAEAIDLGCLPDRLEAIADAYHQADNCDVIVPVGGASVGDHDYVKPAFYQAGGTMIFEKIAVRPGKPTWFGAIKNCHVLGLPGNPASAVICARLFVQPLITALLGHQSKANTLYKARLAAPLSANGPRESYLRASCTHSENGALQVTPHSKQDSSLLRPFAQCNALLRRLPGAKAAAAGEDAQIMFLSNIIGPGL